MKYTRNRFNVAIASILLIIIGVWRLPANDMRLYLELAFQIGVILLFASILWIHTNKWIALFLLLVGFSQIYPIYTTYSQQAFINILCGILWYFSLIVFVNNTNNENEIFINAIAIIALCHVFFLILQTINIDPFHLSKGNRHINAIAGMMTNRNEVACLLAICFPAFFYKKWRYMIWIPIIGIILAKSTGGLISIVITGFLYYTFSGYLMAVTYLVVSIAAIILFIKYIDVPTVKQRWQIWVKIFEYFKQHWILGSGIGHLKCVTLLKDFRFIDNAFGKLWWKTANNEFVQLTFEMGIGFVLILYGYLQNSIKRAIKHKPIIPTIALFTILFNCTWHYLFHNGVNAIMATTWLAIFERELQYKEMIYGKQ